MGPELYDIDEAAESYLQAVENCSVVAYQPPGSPIYALDTSLSTTSWHQQAYVDLASHENIVIKGMITDDQSITIDSNTIGVLAKLLQVVATSGAEELPDIMLDPRQDPLVRAVIAAYLHGNVSPS